MLGLAIFFGKRQAINTLDFAAHMVSVAATQLFHFHMETFIDNT